MAKFTPSAKTASDFNNGNEYVNHVDSPSAEDFNNVIESQLYTQGLATNQPDTSEAGNVGTPSVEIITASDGSARMKFKNLKGATGTTGQTGPTGNDGTSIYTTNNILVTSGTGTISRTDISIPSGHNAQVGDLIMDTQGTLVRITSANVSVVSYEFYSSLTANSPKSLYNLGAYDTYASNGDGTATITRKTGYVVINSENITTLNTDNNIRYVETNVFITDVNGTAWQHTVGKCSQPLTVMIGDDTSLIDGNVKNAILIRYLISSSFYNDGAIILQKENLETLQDYKNLCPLYIQYELATSYTETVIENQPIHTLDQNGEEWLRSEWEKGLNLLDDNSLKGVVLTDTSYFWSIPISLEAGTYTIYIYIQDVGALSECFAASLQTSTGTNVVSNILSGGGLNNSCNWPHTFTITEEEASQIEKLFLFYQAANRTELHNKKISGILISKSANIYPYQPYNGKIIHEADLDKLMSDTVQTVEANVVTSTSNRTYAVQKDEEGQLVVNVPWTDDNTTYSLATTSDNGLLRQLDGSTSHFMRGDGTWATPPNTTYGNATISTAGLMSASDKAKLNGIANEATHIVVDSLMSSTSTNPVQNKVVNQAINDAKDAVKEECVNLDGTQTITGEKMFETIAFSEGGVKQAQFDGGSISLYNNGAYRGSIVWPSGTINNGDELALRRNIPTKLSDLQNDIEITSSDLTVYLNGMTRTYNGSKEVDLGTIYAPVTVGSSGQVLKTSGGGAPYWDDPDPLVAYPVGSIYMSYNSTSPASLFGGSWTKISNRFLYAQGTYSRGATGGAETVTLTGDQMPSHNHNLNIGWQSGGSSSAGFLTANGGGGGWWTSQNTGGGEAHNNMPPYLVVYMWRRTA